VPRHFIRKSDFDCEIERFNAAIQKSREELIRVRDLVLDHLDENHAQIIDAQLMAIQDEEMIKAVQDLVHREQKNVTWAYYEVMNVYEELLLKTYDQYFKERTTDLRDIKKRVLHHLSNEKDILQPEINVASIIVTEKISPSDLIHIDHRQALGIITRYGSVDSHAGILARAFRVPYISNISNLEELVSYSEIILDADNEVILLDVSNEIKAEFAPRIRDFQILREQIINRKVVKKTKDNVPYEIFINAGFVDEVKAINPKLVQGIGLFRTEFLCLKRNTIPDEEEQYEAYQTILKQMTKLPVVFRVFDFGRDKLMLMLDLEVIQEDHIFDEWGGIGFLLENPVILRNQLRALLRASVNGNTQIMLPLVMSINDVLQTKTMLEEIKEELKQANIAFSEDVKLGAMIETSSILEELDELAQHVDFFSIGTNDLALYLIGSGRTVDMAKNYYHPKMFGAIDRIVKSAEKAGIPVNVCGEMASDPYALIGLTAIGIRSISVSSSALSAISDEVGKFDTSQCRAVADALLNAKDATVIYSILKECYRGHIQ